MFFFSSESPLVAAGTNFQKRVWHHIRAIPYGSDITYQGLAKLAGSPKGSRAVGMACGANQIALMIPCHRVVAVNGLGGFAGGVNIKKDLLAHEQSAKNSRMNRS
jgi:O-6-methylguanine DNA methyltransferase